MFCVINSPHIRNDDVAYGKSAQQWPNYWREGGFLFVGVRNDEDCEDD